MSVNSATPFLQVLPPSTRQTHRRVSVKDVFVKRKQNLTLNELSQHEGYRVYYFIFARIRWLLILLGLWAPRGGGWGHWCLRNLYPVFIYICILYPWTTFLTQEAYWSVPVFLFINLHLSGIFAYRSARKYWKQQPNHLVSFITSTFIPFYDDISQFQRSYERSIKQTDDQSHSQSDTSFSHKQKTTTLQMGFQQRNKKYNRQRNRMTKKYHQYGIGIGLGGFGLATATDALIQQNNVTKSRPVRSQNQSAQKQLKHKEKQQPNEKKSDDEFDEFDIHESLKKIRQETADPFLQKEENISSWSNIAGTENKLSLSLFYEATQRLWWRFWVLTIFTALPIVAILLLEIISKHLHSSISTNSDFKSPIFIDIFIPLNTAFTFVRIFYNICEFAFMALYFQFICECHRGDLLIHLHYYDISDIENVNESMLIYYNSLEFRLASIVWDWDRIAASTRDTSKAFRWWLLVNVMFNFIAGVTAVVNLTTQDLSVFPQHLEMYLPAIINLLVSFYVLFAGNKVSHMNKTVLRRTYFLLANAHFGHVEVPQTQNINSRIVPPMLSNVIIHNSNSNGAEQVKEVIPEHEECEENMDKAEEVQNEMQARINAVEIQIRKQNLYIQAQTVARQATSREIAISVYGLVLSRNLFLAFFSPFVAFFLFCINTWLPG